MPRETTYLLGTYAQDEWRATPNLVLDLGIRIDRNGNPLCTSNCFTLYKGGFPASGVTLSTPYNATLATHVSNLFPSVQKAVFEPRAGFNWDTTGHGKTVLRGGIGLFSTLIGSNSLQAPFTNFPNFYSPEVLGGIVAVGAGSANAAAVASNAGVTNGFSQGRNINQIAASLPPGVPFTPPTLFVAEQKWVNPTFLEWSLQVQQLLTQSDAFIVSYAGNHGQHLLLGNQHLNQSLGASEYFPRPAMRPLGACLKHLRIHASERCQPSSQMWSLITTVFPSRTNMSAMGVSRRTCVQLVAFPGRYLQQRDKRGLSGKLSNNTKQRLRFDVLEFGL